MIKLYNTLTREKEIFEPITDNHVRMYVCGITVYDFCHIGHARSSIVFDVIRRYLLYKGYKVTIVKNFTDIDDKIINRSNELNIDYKELAGKFIKEHDIDMEGLNIMKPDYEPKATDYIDGMIDLCKKLIVKGYAYEVDGDVYYRVSRFKGYGKLSHRNTDDLLAGARVEINDIKENPLDFALWKKSKENEPSWESPWGYGRPGWHIECSVMSTKILGMPFDIHGGGKDLIFPHHENEIAQSEASEDKYFAKYWLHNGFVNINKEKMSKSLGNFFSIRDIASEFSYEVIRFFLLTSHYRGTLDFSISKLIEAENALGRIYTLMDEMAHYSPSESNNKTMTDEIDMVTKDFTKNFNNAMDDDFSTPIAISVFFDYVKKINIYMAKKPNNDNFESLKKEFYNIIEIIRKTLGLINMTAEEWFDRNLDIKENELIALINKRNNARQSKDFKKADEIRNKLKMLGIELIDTLNGTRYRTKKLHKDLDAGADI